MKNLFRISMLVLAAALFAVSCSKDNIIDEGGNNGGGNNGGTDEPQIGYLILEGMNVSVSPDIETLENTTKPSSAPAMWTRSVTRATAEDADASYKVEITNITNKEKPELTWSGTYADIKAMTKPMELTPGRYSITACSPEAVQPVAWEKPEYAGTTEFSIVKKLQTKVTDLVCTLSNIKTTVELSADLKKLFKENGDSPLKTVLDLAGTKCEFARDEDRAVYFEAVNSSSTLTMTLSGEYNVKGEGETPQYEYVESIHTIDNVKAGQWRRIAISIEHADDGNVQFKVTIETWVYDQMIDVDVMSGSYVFGEDTIPDEDEETTDPDAPVLQLDGNHNIADPFRITSSSFDPDFGNCLDRISIVATPNGSSTVKDAYCVFDSDNAAFLAAITDAGYADYKVALYPDNTLTQYAVIRTDAANRLLIKVSDAGMTGLFNYEGTHTAKIVITDNQNRRSYTKLTISVVKGVGSGPQITGLNGYDFGRRYTISRNDNPTLKVALEITSATGITGFDIEIIGGNVLPDKELEGLSLASKMDLINPATPAMEIMLKELGFLPKDGSGVEGKTKLTFDISEFIPAMCVLPGKGNCDFKLTVTDASGSIEKTIMLTVVD